MPEMALDTAMRAGDQSADQAFRVGFLPRECAVARSRYSR